MMWLRHIFDFYLDSSIHVALAVFSLVQVTLLTFNITTDHHFSWFLFFGTITSYNFIKYGVEAEKYIKVANQYHKGIQFFSFIAFAAAIYHAYFLNLDVWLGVLILLFLTAIYAIPVLPHAKNLRSLGGLKVFVVALVWAGTTVTLPNLMTTNFVSWDIWVETFQRFLVVLVLLIPFEIRDLKYDDPGLQTLPQRFGVTKTKIIGAFIVVLFFFSTFMKYEIPTFELIGKGVLFLVLGSLMFITKRNQTTYFSSFWVEGIPIFWYVLVVGLKSWVH